MKPLLIYETCNYETLVMAIIIRNVVAFEQHIFKQF